MFSTRYLKLACLFLPFLIIRNLYISLIQIFVASGQTATLPLRKKLEEVYKTGKHLFAEEAVQEPLQSQPPQAPHPMQFNKTVREVPEDLEREDQEGPPPHERTLRVISRRSRS